MSTDGVHPNSSGVLLADPSPRASPIRSETPSSHGPSEVGSSTKAPSLQLPIALYAQESKPTPLPNVLPPESTLPARFDPTKWDLDLITRQPESDDELHDPTTLEELQPRRVCSARNIGNYGCLALLVLAVLGLCIALPIVTTLRSARPPPSVEPRPTSAPSISARSATVPNHRYYRRDR